MRAESDNGQCGFIPDEPESIMIGEASALAVDVPLPDGVTLRQVMTEFDVRAMSAMHSEIFCDPSPDDMAGRAEGWLFGETEKYEKCAVEPN